jgi:uncharacterized protein (TIGR02757 family)
MRRRTIPGLKEKLDNLYREVNKPEFIALDPVKFPHRYKNRHDIEVAAFLAATIAWGRRDLILRSCEMMFALMGESPYNYVMNGDRRKHSGGSRGLNIHRTFFEDDLRYFCRGLRACYDRYGSLEALFGSAGSVWEGIALLRETMARGQGKLAVYSRHIANPDSGSACKRLNLALRWLVRREGPVDLGLWKTITPSSLFIPLDIHVGRAARSLGLLETRANDKKAVMALTGKLREFCPDDPVKYDLALFGYSLA